RAGRDRAVPRRRPAAARARTGRAGRADRRRARGPHGVRDRTRGDLLMLYSTTTPAQRRERLRERLAGDGLLRFPGALNPLSARLIEEKGFEGVYVSGAVLAADLGLPDIGLTTLTEVAGRGQQIARMTDLPEIGRASCRERGETSAVAWPHE